MNINYVASSKFVKNTKNKQTIETLSLIQFFEISETNLKTLLVQKSR